MPNIGLHGYGNAVELRERILSCIQKVGLGSEAITEIVRSETQSCDGNDGNMPFLSLFSPELKNVEIILEGFSKNGIHEDVEVISEKIMFFIKEEVASGDWKKKFEEKTKS